MESRSGARAAVRPGFRIDRSLALVLLAGLGSGALGAYVYYDDVLRPLSHTLTIWIALAACVSARHGGRQAVVRATVVLLSAVLAFYVGKQVMYTIEYPGMPYEINMTVVGVWCIFAVVGGLALGSAFCGIGSNGWRDSASTAAAIGLLVGDAYRRTSNYHADTVVVVTATLAASLLISWLRIRSARQILRVALLAPRWQWPAGRWCLSRTSSNN
ncbi:hypothetical protein BH20ACT5_BH20ACT5_08780 [soil metagenome]